MENAPLLPPLNASQSDASGEQAKPVLALPSPKAQSWGAIISIIVIVLMIIIGAFYAWGARIAEQNDLLAPTSQQ